MDEINLTVFQCPVCGGVLDFNEGDETVCKSCGNQVHKFKTKTEVNLKLDYAVVSDGGTYRDSVELVPEDLFAPKAPRASEEVPRADSGADVLALNGLTKQLIWNYSSPNKLNAAEKKECLKRVAEIQEIDAHNIYSEFLTKIVFPEKVLAKDAEEVLGRRDALEIHSYILPVLREKDYQGIGVTEFFVDYIAHCPVPDIEKYNNIMAVLTSKYFVVASLAEVKPILVDILGLKIPCEKRCKLLTLIYASIALPPEQDSLEDVYGFFQYVAVSDLTPEQKSAILTNFIKLDVGRFASFDQTVKFLNGVLALDIPAAEQQKLVAAVLKKCAPRSLSFEGYFNLSSFIAEPVARFRYLFYLFLGSYNSLFFKLDSALLFYEQGRIGADEMLLFLEMVRAFAEDNVKPEKVAQLRAEIDAKQSALNLSRYTDIIKNDKGCRQLFAFLERYAAMNPVATVAGLTRDTQYGEDVEKALYSMTALRLYYHKIYDCGIVAPYTTLDKLDSTVARLNDIKTRFIAEGGKPVVVAKQTAERAPLTGTDVAYHFLSVLLPAFLCFALTTFIPVPAYLLILFAGVSLIWMILLHAVRTSGTRWPGILIAGLLGPGALYLAVQAILTRLFGKNRL